MTFPSCDLLFESHVALSSAVCPASSGRSFASMEVAPWRLSGCIGGRGHRNNTGTHKINIMIPNLGDNFFLLESQNLWSEPPPDEVS